MRRSNARPIVLAGAAVAVLAGALIATNVGGERMPKAEYERRVQAVYLRVQEAFLATRVENPADLDERVAGAQAELRAAAGELEELDPPREVEAETELLAAAMRDYADDLEALRLAAARGDAAAIERFNSTLPANDSIRRLTAAAEGLKEKGYDVGQLAED